MPIFTVTQYFTYADRFDVLAETPEEAQEKVDQWYATVRGPMPEPPCHLDADVHPIVTLTDKNDFVDADGWRVCDEHGEEVLDG